MGDNFYRRLDEAQMRERTERIFRNRPENLHDYQGCANDMQAQQRTSEQPLVKNPETTCSHCSGDMTRNSRCSHGGLCVSVADFDSLKGVFKAKPQPEVPGDVVEKMIAAFDNYGDPHTCDVKGSMTAAYQVAAAHFEREKQHLKGDELAEEFQRGWIAGNADKQQALREQKERLLREPSREEWRAILLRAGAPVDAEENRIITFGNICDFLASRSTVQTKTPMEQLADHLATQYNMDAGTAKDKAMDLLEFIKRIGLIAEMREKEARADKSSDNKGMEL